MRALAIDFNAVKTMLMEIGIGSDVMVYNMLYAATHNHIYTPRAVEGGLHISSTL